MNKKTLKATRSDHYKKASIGAEECNTATSFSFQVHLAMSLSKPLFRSVFVMLLLLVATEMGGMVAEARTCESHSHHFKGLCFSHHNCASVCKTEGFHGGHCRGFRRRCFCTKHC